VNIPTTQPSLPPCPPPLFLEQNTADLPLSMMWSTQQRSMLAFFLLRLFFLCSFSKHLFPFPVAMDLQGESMKIIVFLAKTTILSIIFGICAWGLYLMAAPHLTTLLWACVISLPLHTLKDYLQARYQKSWGSLIRAVCRPTVPDLKTECDLTFFSFCLSPTRASSLGAIWLWGPF
jgi:hypothetical protein